MYYNKGVDSGGLNFGGNIFKDYDTRVSSYGVGLIHGVKAQCASVNLNLAYELKENLFIGPGWCIPQMRFRKQHIPYTINHIYIRRV